MDELKACPFCGGKLRTEEYRGTTNFLCDACGAVISFCFSEERKAAIKAVNRRATPKNVRNLLEIFHTLRHENANLITKIEQMRNAASENEPLTLEQVESIKSDLVDAMVDSFLQGYQYGKDSEEYFEDGLHANAWDSINEIFNAYTRKPEGSEHP